MVTDAERPTLRVTDIPPFATAKDLLHALESRLGSHTVFAIEIATDRNNWKSRGFGRVQFASLEAKSRVLSLSLRDELLLKSYSLRFSDTYDDIIPRPIRAHHRTENGVLHAGFMGKEDCLWVLERWEGVRGWVMPERRRVEFWVSVAGECYKLDVMFGDVLEAVGFRLGGSKLNALLLKIKYAPRIYQKSSGPNISPKFKTDRYHICKEDFDFLWIRTTDFSEMKSIGQSVSFCWELPGGSSASDIFSCFPCYKEDLNGINLEKRGDFVSASEVVPLVRWPSKSSLPYEILFQLNSLVHTQKLSLGSINAELIEMLSGLQLDVALRIMQKLHKQQTTCYDSLSCVKAQYLVLQRNPENLPLSSEKRLTDQNVMSCHRALVTPSKIYCLGPELETSNYVVKHFAEYASDFMRITFVEEDWSKLPVNSISTDLQCGMFPKPYRTKIYWRILSILQNGIVIGPKKFEFLAFSASQLRSSSAWMFASNEKVKAGDIRDWMGCFKNIRSVSKCAARMGQLFSSSMPTLTVPAQDVEIIPDIEINVEDVKYCFSDGIGKISLSFARQIAQRCGLNHTPSAFQIRYGGYKGVIAVDRNSFRKMSLRRSMLKFESKVKMLNVTKWSVSMPCFLNREIVSLLSTLGIKDEVFEEMQGVQLCNLGKMLTNSEAALSVLQIVGGVDAKNILVKMLLQGYDPNVEPYLSMMLNAHHSILLADLKSRCRIFVPKGRILIGCLDEIGILDYGQVYCCLRMTKAEKDSADQSFFHVLDEEKGTTVVVGKLVVTKNPCLHPGDIRVLDAVYDEELEEKGLVDCLVFPQKGKRPHPNECSGGDLDGDQFFISWDKDLIPCETEAPMNYSGGRPRIMDHDVTLEEIQKFFADYMISDTLGAISTAHLVHADREQNKARSDKCLELAKLHSMAVDFAKTGAPAEMPRALKPRDFPDFMERTDKPMYISQGVLGKLYRATVRSIAEEKSKLVWSKTVAEAAYDHDLEVNGFEGFLAIAESQRTIYEEKMNTLMNYYGAGSEDEILTGNLGKKPMHLQRDNRRYGDMKDRILLSLKNLQKEMKELFEKGCKSNEQQRLASAWYHVTYHPSYFQEGMNCLSFPWIVGDILLSIKSVNSREVQRKQPVYANVYRKSPRKAADGDCATFSSTEA